VIDFSLFFLTTAEMFGNTKNSVGHAGADFSSVPFEILHGRQYFS